MLPVAKDRVHIPVAAEYPSIQQPAAMRLALVAQRRIGGIRVLCVPARHRVVGDAGLQALPHEHGLDGGLSDRLLQG